MTNTSSTTGITAARSTDPNCTGRQGRKPRRMARPTDADVPLAGKRKVQSKLDKVEALLLGEGGASIAEIMAATGWQQHSVRGAIAGALKNRGLTITSDKVDAVRRYRASRAA